MKQWKKEYIPFGIAASSLLFGILLANVYPAVRFTGLLFCLAAGVLVLWGILNNWSKQRRWAVLAKRMLTVLLLLGVLLFVCLETAVVSWAKTDAESAVDGVIVLGAGVNGTVPSLSLRVRLEAALDYIADKPTIPIVVTGSQGQGEDISEARCMADWLIAHGVEESRILVEDQADDTEENIAFSKSLLLANGYDISARYAVVSNDYHLCRAAMYWEQPDMVPVAAKMPAPYQQSLLTVNYYIREAFALAAELPRFLKFYCNSYSFPIL